MESFIGHITMFGGNFAPRGWAFCDGQLLAPSVHPALFSILGTLYGGDGRNTFALPDLRGRAPLHHGHGPDLSHIPLGIKSGRERTTLTNNNLPKHHHHIPSHQVVGDIKMNLGQGIGVSNIGTNNYLAFHGGPDDTPYTNAAPDAFTLNQNAIDSSNLRTEASITMEEGAGEPFYNRSPFLAISFIIALEGVYPSKD